MTVNQFGRDFLKTAPTTRLSSPRQVGPDWVKRVKTTTVYLKITLFLFRRGVYGVSGEK